MEVPLLVIAIVGLFQGSFAEKVCIIAGQTIVSPTDRTYYYKCLAPGISVQLRCPPGQYFSEVGDKCVTSGLLEGIPFPMNPGMPANQDAQQIMGLPTVPVVVVTAPTQKPSAGDNIAAENAAGSGSPVSPPKAPVNSKDVNPVGGNKTPVFSVPPAPPNAKKGQKTTKRQRATTPAGKPVSKRKTTAAANGKKKPVQKRRKV